MNEHQIAASHISLQEINDFLEQGAQLRLGDDADASITNCRDYLDQRLNDGDEVFYGINTGFGSQYHVRISQEEVFALQKNLILSHSAGAGDVIDKDVARAIILLKVISIAKGHSAVSKDVVERLLLFFNKDLIPVIYKMGSLGASGDLAPLAHMSLALIGKGEFYLNNGFADVSQALKSLGLEPLRLQSKEGLGLINGTQFSTAHGILACFDGNRLLNWANISAAASLEAFSCNLTPFDPRIHKLRPHSGQMHVAKTILELLAGSKTEDVEKHLQDPYSFRCVPQVHGATYDALAYVSGVLETEINSVTDNPLVFPESDAIISGGNFHAQPVALVLDYLAIAIAELGSISERRTYQLLSATRGLPACLVKDAGLQSGLMIAQYTAASIVNRNKILCTPASIDSIPSSMGQEDHVSMAANSATKLREVVQNVKTIIGIEFLSAMQAIELRNNAGNLSPALDKLYNEYRRTVPFINEDVVLHDLFIKTQLFFDKKN
jgi:histidine ammonia-lyase